MDLGWCLAWRSVSKLQTTLESEFRRCARVPKAHLRITTYRLLGNVASMRQPCRMRCGESFEFPCLRYVILPTILQKTWLVMSIINHHRSPIIRIILTCATVVTINHMNNMMYEWLWQRWWWRWWRWWWWWWWSSSSWWPRPGPVTITHYPNITIKTGSALFCCLGTASRLGHSFWRLGRCTCTWTRGCSKSCLQAL